MRPDSSDIRHWRSARARGAKPSFLLLLRLQQSEEGLEHRGVVVPGAAAHQVAVDDRRLVDVLGSPLFAVELALGDRRYAAALDHARGRQDFDAVADGADRLAGI